MEAATVSPKPTHHEHQSFWVWVMCLTGVDYFSTLGYQPSIAFEAAGIVAPIATIVLVLVTLFGALPVYSHVASRSTEGQGSIAMLERLMRGWTGKVVVLSLLGFAATDFVITKTLSAADAVEHLMHNPIWKAHAPGFLQAWGTDGQRVALTMGMLVLLGASFLRGMREVVGLAVVIVGVYLTLNAVVIGSGLVYLIGHPDRFQLWLQHLQEGSAAWHIPQGHLPAMGDGWGAVAMISILIFPKLALGLSGFETGVAVMPLIKGDADDTLEHPKGRIRNAKKLLLTAALIMSVCLLGSSLVTAMLIDPADMAHGGPAEHRALAFIAHGQSSYLVANPIFGDIFGTIYDIATIVILGFAGASAMTGLLSLVPRYLPRYGMAPEWARVTHWLVIAFTVINLFVTWIFNADVSAQGGAYATGVLVLMSSACVATVIDVFRSRAGKFILFRIPWKYLAIGVVFVYTTG
ncbi:MAG: amino acid transporter, partial [Planctomycetia bacterium]|nr:amino acid transporter [Planctomycetia bacterium]